MSTVKDDRSTCISFITLLITSSNGDLKDGMRPFIKSVVDQFFDCSADRKPMTLENLHAICDTSYIKEMWKYVVYHPGEVSIITAFKKHTSNGYNAIFPNSSTV